MPLQAHTFKKRAVSCKVALLQLDRLQLAIIGC